MVRGLYLFLRSGLGSVIFVGSGLRTVLNLESGYGSVYIIRSGLVSVMGSRLSYGDGPVHLFFTVLLGSGLGFLFIPWFAVGPVVILGSIFIIGKIFFFAICNWGAHHFTTRLRQ